jgi:hypothetical protein
MDALTKSAHIVEMIRKQIAEQLSYAIKVPTSDILTWSETEERHAKQEMAATIEQHYILTPKPQPSASIKDFAASLIEATTPFIEAIKQAGEFTEAELKFFDEYGGEVTWSLWGGGDYEARRAVYGENFAEIIRERLQKHGFSTLSRFVDLLKIVQRFQSEVNNA